jgi:integrase
MVWLSNPQRSGLRIDTASTEPARLPRRQGSHAQRTVGREGGVHASAIEEGDVPHLRAVLIAILETACRPGETLSPQWGEVSLTRKETTIRAVTEKIRRERIIPISLRLMTEPQL